MKSAIVFPGQGSQFVGMGRDFYDNFVSAREVFEKVDDALNYRLSQIIFDGPSEELTLTKYTQPALMTTSIAIVETLKNETGYTIDKFANYAAGHSLGEYTALCATNAITLEDTARLLQLRGDSMQKAVPQGQGSMAAILGMTEDEIENSCAKIREFGICQIANNNCPGQIVVSGATLAIDKLVQSLQEQGKKAIKLAVSAPFHCSMMDPVKEIMYEALQKINVLTPILPLVANVSAKIENSPEKIKENLVEQVSLRVEWNASMNLLTSKGVNNIIEIGAGKVLSGLMKRIDKNITSINISNIEDFKNFINIQ